MSGAQCGYRPWSARKAAALAAIADRDAKKSTAMAAAGAAACDGPYRPEDFDCCGRCQDPEEQDCHHCGLAVHLNRQAMAGCALAGMLVGLIIAAIVAVVTK